MFATLSQILLKLGDKKPESQKAYRNAPRAVHGQALARLQQARRAPWILPARYVGVQVADGLRLLGDDCVDQVAD